MKRLAEKTGIHLDGTNDLESQFQNLSEALIQKLTENEELATCFDCGISAEARLFFEESLKHLEEIEEKCDENWENPIQFQKKDNTIQKIKRLFDYLLTSYCMYRYIHEDKHMPMTVTLIELNERMLETLNQDFTGIYDSDRPLWQKTEILVNKIMSQMVSPTEYGILKQAQIENERMTKKLYELLEDPDSALNIETVTQQELLDLYVRQQEEVIKDKNESLSQEKWKNVGAIVNYQNHIKDKLLDLLAQYQNLEENVDCYQQSAEDLIDCLKKNIDDWSIQYNQQVFSLKKELQKTQNQLDYVYKYQELKLNEARNMNKEQIKSIAEYIYKTLIEETTFGDYAEGSNFVEGQKEKILNKIRSGFFDKK